MVQSGRISARSASFFTLISVTAMALFHSELAGGAPTENRRRSNLQRRRRHVVDGFRFPSDHDRRRARAAQYMNQQLSPSLLPSALYRATPGARGEVPKFPLRIHAASGEQAKDHPFSRRLAGLANICCPLSFPFPPLPLLPTLRCVGSVSRQHRLLSRIPPPSILQPASLPSFIVYTAAPFEKGSIDRVATAEPFSILQNRE